MNRKTTTLGALTLLVAGLAVVVVLARGGADSNAKVTPLITDQPALSTTITPSLAPSTTSPVANTSTSTTPKSTSGSGTTQNNTASPPTTRIKRVTDDVLQSMYQDVDGILVRYGKGELTLEKYASAIAKLRTKWAAYGLGISMTYKGEQEYFHLKLGTATYCIKVVWQDGTWRGIPAACP